MLKTLSQAADWLNVPEATLRYWVHIGTAPHSARVGRRRMFRQEDLEAFVADKFKVGSAA